MRLRSSGVDAGLGLAPGCWAQHGGLFLEGIWNVGLFRFGASK